MSMVEQVARELLRCTIANDGERRGTESWPEYLADARKLIAAMRIPTDRMIRAGDTVHEDDEHHGGGIDVGMIWERMVDAALEDKNARSVA